MDEVQYAVQNSKSTIEDHVSTAALDALKSSNTSMKDIARFVSHQASKYERWNGFQRYVRIRI